MSTASVFILPTTGTFIVEVVIFLTLLYLLAKYVLPPLNAAAEKASGRTSATPWRPPTGREPRRPPSVTSAARHSRRARHQAREIVEQANRTAEQLAADAAAKRQADSDQAQRPRPSTRSSWPNRHARRGRGRRAHGGPGGAGGRADPLRREVGVGAPRPDRRGEGKLALRAAGGSQRPCPRRPVVVNPALEGYSSAALAGSGDVAQVADQLIAVDDAVLRQRRAVRRHEADLR